jgi:hypothetical protein
LSRSCIKNGALRRHDRFLDGSWRWLIGVSGHLGSFHCALCRIAPHITVTVSNVRERASYSSSRFIAQMFALMALSRPALLPVPLADDTASALRSYTHMCLQKANTILYGFEGIFAEIS